jgi:hypothetical protein
MKNQGCPAVIKKNFFNHVDLLKKITYLSRLKF